MKSVIAAVTIVAASLSPTASQTIVDGSGDRIDPDLRQRIMETVAEETRDPYSVQFRRMRASGNYNVYCGQFNARNGFGAYAGFIDFRYHDGHVTFIDFDDIPAMIDLKKLVMKECITPR